jgi:hypothetical protein
MLGLRHRINPLKAAYGLMPRSAPDILSALGYPAGWAAANALGAYLCEDATNQTDALGLGPALVKVGSSTTGYAVSGLRYPKNGVRLPTNGANDGFAAADSGVFANASSSIVSILVVGGEDAGQSGALVQKRDSHGYVLVWTSATTLAAYALGSVNTKNITLATAGDGNQHCYGLVVDDIGKTISIVTKDTLVTSPAYSGTVATTAGLGIGYCNAVGANAAGKGSVSGVYVFNFSLTQAMVATFSHLVIGP